MCVSYFTYHHLSQSEEKCSIRAWSKEKGDKNKQYVKRAKKSKNDVSSIRSGLVYSFLSRAFSCCPEEPRK
jgi:hypothetical protein